MRKSSPKTYVPEQEVSRITGRGVQTLRNDRHLGRGIPYVKFGRSVRYSVDDIINFMELHKVDTDSS